MRFASFFPGRFITTIVVNQPERKLAKRTSVRSTARNFMVCIKLSHDFFRSKSRWEWKICPKYWRFCQNCNMEPNKCKYSMGLQFCYLLLTMQKFFKSWPSCKKKPKNQKGTLEWNLFDEAFNSSVFSQDVYGKFSNFSCMFLNPNNFSQFEF